MTTLIKREFWEHRSFWIVPLIVVALQAAGTITALITGSVEHGAEMLEGLGAVAGMNGAERKALWSVGAIGHAAPFYVALLFLGFFYLIDSLYGERKDRSVLFWKSLPVSDTNTVISKFLTGSFALPLVLVAASVAGLLINAIIFSIALAFAGYNPLPLLFQPIALIEAMLLLTYGAFAIGLWLAPFAAWLMLASSVARGWPMLWAVLPPLAIAFLEFWVFRTTGFRDMIGNYLSNAGAAFRDHEIEDLAVRMDDMDGLNIDSDVGSLLALVDPVGLLTSPSLWIGLVVAAAFLAGAIFMRRYREAM